MPFLWMLLHYHSRAQKLPACFTRNSLGMNAEKNIQMVPKIAGFPWARMQAGIFI